MQVSSHGLKINLYALKTNDHAANGKFSVCGMVFFLYVVYIKNGKISCIKCRILANKAHRRKIDGDGDYVQNI